MKRYIITENQYNSVMRRMTEEDDENSGDTIRKLYNLISSGDKGNIEMAYMLGLNQPELNKQMADLIQQKFATLKPYLKMRGSVSQKHVERLFGNNSLEIGDNSQLENGSLPQVVSDMGKLNKITLNDVSISDLNPLCGTNISTVRINGGNIKSLPSCHNIVNLYVNGASIPTEMLGNLPNLKDLSLEDMGLTQFPPALAKLKNLEDISIDGNNIEQIPDWVGKLPKLQALHLDGYVKNIEDFQRANPNISIVPTEGDFYDDDYAASKAASETGYYEH